MSQAGQRQFGDLQWCGFEPTWTWMRVTIRIGHAHTIVCVRAVIILLCILEGLVKIEKHFYRHLLML